MGKIENPWRKPRTGCCD